MHYPVGMEEIAEALAQIVLERERLVASRALLKAMIEGQSTHPLSQHTISIHPLSALSFTEPFH